ncbi:MAG: aspartate carbamoyltransferase regulatory subunit [Sulfolobaceae archaeon]
MSEKELVVSKIKNGTVIDHIPAGKALVVLKILGISGNESNRVSLVMNVESKKLGKKDIVKIEDRFLDEKETSLISLVAPTATINIVRDYKVIEKRKISLPKVILDLLKCPNPYCITNNDPEAKSKFVVVRSNPLIISCIYCETRLEEDEILRQVLDVKG